MEEHVEPQEPPRRLRLAAFSVQPILTWDDGENLTPGPQTQPQVLTLVGLRELVEKWPETLADIERLAPQQP